MRVISGAVAGMVFIRVSATGQESGAQVEIRAAHEITIRDGLLVRFQATRTGSQPSKP